MEPALDLPDHDEIEVTLLGPGYGESVVVHIGGFRWIVIDSCVRTGEVSSAALDYFKTIGVDPESDVALIVATHWHDDHIRGLASLLRECRSAEFSCPVALRSDEFLVLTQSSQEVGSKFSSGVKEFREVIDVLNQRNRTPKWATGSRRLLLSSGTAVEEIWALGPTDRDVTIAMRAFEHLVVPSGHVRSRASSWNQNDASIAVVLVGADTSVLLGADMEHHRSVTDRGWHGVLTESGRPQTESALFKVAHHGSADAHCDALWGKRCRPRITAPSRMLIPGTTVSILAPWRQGGSHLPTEADLNRLKGLSFGVYVTTNSVDSAFGGRDQIADYAAQAEAVDMAPLTPKPGLIRCRYKVGGPWRMDSLPDW